MFEASPAWHAHDFGMFKSRHAAVASYFMTSHKPCQMMYNALEAAISNSKFGVNCVMRDYFVCISILALIN